MDNLLDGREEHTGGISLFCRIDASILPDIGKDFKAMLETVDKLDLLLF